MIKILIAFISRLSKREKSIFFVTVFLIFSFIVHSLILNPALLRLWNLNKEINEQEKTIKKNLLMLSREDEIIAEYNKYAPYFEKVESKNEESTSFLKSMENLAKNSSVELLDIKPSPSQEGDLTREYSITLNCAAPMNKIFDFLYSIESSEQLFNIEKINLSPKEGGVTCNMSVSKVLILPGDSKSNIK